MLCTYVAQSPACLQVREALVADVVARGAVPRSNSLAVGSVGQGFVLAQLSATGLAGHEAALRGPG